MRMCMKLMPSLVKQGVTETFSSSMSRMSGRKRSICVGETSSLYERCMSDWRRQHRRAKEGASAKLETSRASRQRGLLQASCRRARLDSLCP